MIRNYLPVNRTKARKRLHTWTSKYGWFKRNLADDVDAWVREHQEKFDGTHKKSIEEMVQLCFENFSSN